MASGNHERQVRYFKEWMKLQEVDLSELLQALSQNSNGHHNDFSLTQLSEKMIQHFEDYIENRKELAGEDITAYFSPTWCSSLENSMSWIGGCRPTSFIRLLHALWGSNVETQLTAFLQGRRRGDLSELSGKQLHMVKDLHIKTILAEDELSRKLASVQESIADEPFARIVQELSQPIELNGVTEKALDDQARGMLVLLEEADGLRVSTLKELLSLLTPIQGVEFLAVSKKHHLCIHEWGKQRDRKHGMK